MAEVDYDPRKAHEYYMKHRKLKGRRSTKGFSKTQKEQVMYAKAQLAEQHQRANQAISDLRRQRSEELSERLANQRKQMTERAKATIDQLRAMLKNMPKEQKALMRDRINSLIGNIRSDLKDRKSELTASGKAERARISAEAKSAREAEKASYEANIDKAIEDIGKSGNKSTNKKSSGIEHIKKSKKKTTATAKIMKAVSTR